MIDKKVGTVSIKYIVSEIRYASICKLDKPTRSGYEYTIVSNSGDTLGFLSKDKEGKWLIEQLYTSGEITGFYND